MKKFICLCVLLSASLIVKSQSLDWYKAIGGSGNDPSGYGDYARVSIDMNSNNEVFVTSNTGSNDSCVTGNHGSLDCYVIKLNENGDTLWTKTIGGSGSELPRDIIALDDGGCIVVGYTYSNDFDFINHHGSSNFADGFICRLNSDGEKLWSKQYGGGENVNPKGIDYFHSIIALSDGDFLVAGHTQSQDGDLSLDYTMFRCGWVMKIDGNGNLLASKRVVTTPHDQYTITIVTDVIELSDGSGVVVIGTVTHRENSGKIWIAKYDTSFTEKIWEKEYGCLSMNLYPSLVEAEQGNIIFTSTVFSDGGDVESNVEDWDIWVVKVNGEGEIVKQDVYTAPGNESSYGLSKDGKGNFVIESTSFVQGGYAHGGDTNNRNDFWMIDFDFNLDTLWTYRFGGNNLDFINRAVPSSNGNYIYGGGWTSSDSGLVTAKYGAKDIVVLKVINPAPRNEFIICGDSVTLSNPVEYKGTGTLSYSWSPSTALSSSSDESPRSAPLTNTTYQVTVSDGAGFTEVGSVFVNVSSFSVDVGSDESLYCGDSVRLNAESNSSNVNYLWSPALAITDSSLYNPYVFSDTTVTYTVIATTMNGCSATDDILVAKNNPVSICMINNVGSNMVVWEKPVTEYIDSFYIYRKESNDTGFSKIAAVPYDSWSVYNDMSSDVTVGGYSYKMSTFACDRESEKSQAHTTMFLKTTFDNDTAWNLEWIPYEGREGTKYGIYRGTSQGNLKWIDNVSGSVFTYRDLNPPAGDVYYQVKLFLEDYCFYMPGIGYNTLSSNVVHDFVDKSKYDLISDNTIEILPTVNSFYSEGFESSDTIPSDITIIDYDKLTTAVGFINDAWVLYKDYADTNNVNNVVITNSYYKPHGKSDDWMIFPRIILKKNAILSWKVETYIYELLEMYEIRLSKTGKELKDFKSVVYMNYAESGPKKTRLVSLEENGFTEGDSVYIAFRSVSESKYVMSVDDINIFTADTILDMFMASVDIPICAEKNESVSIKGKLINFSADKVGSLDINWMVEGESTINTQSLSNLNIGSYGEYSFVHNKKWTPTVYGNNTVKVWASNINGKADEDNSNDTLFSKVVVLESYPVKHVLVEEGTGAWCGFCPDGAVKMDELLKEDSTMIAVAIHSGDAMEFEEGNVVASNYFTGYPAAIVDRYRFSDGELEIMSRSEWKSRAVQRKNIDIPVEVKGTHTYNPVTRKLTVKIKSQFLVDYFVDLRMNCFIVEDSVSGDGAMYDQTNYFNTDYGHPMFGLGSPIIGYQHRHVVREMLGGPWGTESSLPDSIFAGDLVEYEYTTTLSADYNDQRISLILLVQKYNADDYTDREVLNAYELHLGKNQDGIDENYQASVEVLRLHPNPTTEIAYLDLVVNTKQNIRIDICDIAGKQISSHQYTNVEANTNHKYMINAKALSQGVYFVKINGEKFDVCKKLIVR